MSFHIVAPSIMPPFSIRASVGKGMPIRSDASLRVIPPMQRHAFKTSPIFIGLSYVNISCCQHIFLDNEKLGC